MKVSDLSTRGGGLSANSSTGKHLPAVGWGSPSPQSSDGRPSRQRIDALVDKDRKPATEPTGRRARRVTSLDSDKLKNDGDLRTPKGAGLRKQGLARMAESPPRRPNPTTDSDRAPSTPPPSPEPWKTPSFSPGHGRSSRASKVLFHVRCTGRHPAIESPACDRLLGVRADRGAALPLAS